jgi:hypothetical protein
MHRAARRDLRSLAAASAALRVRLVSVMNFDLRHGGPEPLGRLGVCAGPWTNLGRLPGALTKGALNR